MKKIFLGLLILIGLGCFAQPSGYTKRNTRERVRSLILDSTLHIPYGTTPALRGGWSGAGALFYKTTDTTAIYAWSGHQFLRIGGTTYTASNGITLSTADFQLGSATPGASVFTSERFINADTYDLVLYSSSSNTLQVSSTDGIAISGSSTNSPGISGASINSKSFYGSINPSSTNSVVTNLLLTRKSSGTAVNGLGEAIDLELQADNGVNYVANRLISKWTTAANATRTSQFIITGVNSGTTADKFTLSGSGALKLNAYGSATFTGTPAYTLQVDASGNVIEGSATSSQTLQQVFNQEVNGSILTKNDTIIRATNKFIFGSNSFIMKDSVDTNKIVALSNDGSIQLKHGTGFTTGSLRVDNLSGSDRTYQLPNASGTIALTSNITTSVVASADSVALTASDAVVASYSVPANGVYRIGGYINVTAVSAGILTLIVDYTDINSNAVSQIIPLTLASTGAIGTTATTVSNNSAVDIQIRAKSGTSLVVRTTLAVGTATYDVGTTIENLR